MSRDPAQFISPMLAITAPMPFDSDEWWYEVKWDGYRALISYIEDLRVYSRHGANLLSRFPDLGQLRDIIPRGTVFDAELVAWFQGKPSFAALQRRESVPHLAMVFDCLYSHQKWHLHEPLHLRREYLQELIPDRQPMVVVSSGLVGQGRELLGEVVEKGLEGVMAKHMMSRYWPGHRVQAWQKFLALRRRWCAVRQVKRLADGHWQWWVGDPSSGSIAARVPAPSRWDPPTGLDHDLTWVSGLWAEIEYREETAGGKFRHARIRQWQNDKLGRDTDHPSQ